MLAVDQGAEGGLFGVGLQGARENWTHGRCALPGIPGEHVLFWLFGGLCCCLASCRQEGKDAPAQG